MKTSFGLLVGFLIIAGCNQPANKPHYWFKKKIERFSVMVPSDYKIWYYTTLDSAAHGCLINKGLKIEYAVGSLVPKVKLKDDEQILKMDTVGSLIVRISTFHIEGDNAMKLEAWDTSEKIIWPSSWGTSSINGIYGISMVAKKFSNEQKDTIMKIFNSLDHTLFDSTYTAKYIKAHKGDNR